MTRISSRTCALPVPLRPNGRCGGGAAVVNPVAAIAADRRGDGRDPRGRRASDRGFKGHLPAPPLSIATSGRMFASLHAIGQQDRGRPDAYEAVSRYEDRFFDPLEPGILSRRYA